ncbi:hypothetical protein CANARDRAFT_7729 [[Candida] arabinofermentans NRRL YB-2248]|uniref:Ubiquitin-conjugating enzyme E2-binding protein n=1 Tax=[Candida] arabinofermentans NRRL YB-2248 TaxID=983967 RepID=A0A1E4T1N0_9ASCO|nr:hypothetical protein CANARDRAFT_7729 [[Candida] arabinofermentans NRRL YB-2248]
MSLDILYSAEYLPRINSISIQLSNIKLNLIESIEISNSNILLITYLSKLYSFKLPSSCSNYNDLKPILSQSGDVISFKLQSTTNNDTNNSTIDQFNDNYKWNNKFISNILDYKPSLKCYNCDHVIVNLIHGSTKLKSMPSESWSEMMDFWHCHKPTTGSYSNNEILNRFNQFKPNLNDLIIGCNYFIINYKQYENESLKLSDGNNDVCCSFCDFKIGKIDENTGNCQLIKWFLKLNYTIDNELIIDDFKPSLFIYNYLLDSINSTAIRYYLFTSTSGDRILIWCFNFGLKLSINDLNLNNCLKIFYSTSNSDIDSFLNDGKSINLNNLDQFELDSIIFNDLISNLNKINKLLPINKFTSTIWKISYLSLDL